MCIMSYVGDTYSDRLNPAPFYPSYLGRPLTPSPNPAYDKWAEGVGLKPAVPQFPNGYVTQKDFDDLKKEVLEMKEMMKKAIRYDEEHNEPHCEDEEKYAVLRKIAEMVGVSLDDVIGKPD